MSTTFVMQTTPLIPLVSTTEAVQFDRTQPTGVLCTSYLGQNGSCVERVSKVTSGFSTCLNEHLVSCYFLCHKTVLGEL